jgi:hypothetical protein
MSVRCRIGLPDAEPRGGRDHCGGDVKVTFFGTPMNLHAVWDYALIDHEQLSFTEWADWLDAPMNRERIAQ